MAAVTLSTIAIGAAIGAGVGAVATYASGGRGDALWKGALTGAVSGAVTGGVGSWAGAGAGGWAGAAAGALAGGAGGVTAGVLGTALNGGNSSDYLKSGLFGGLSGAAVGGLMGGLGGSVNGELPADAQGIPTTADGGYAFDDAVAGSVVDPTTASGMSGGTVGTAAIDPTLATTTPATTTPQLSDTVSSIANNQFAAAPTNTMTDIAGSSAIPQELPGGVPTNTASQTPSTGELSFTFDDYPSQAQVDIGAANPMETQSAANSYEFKLKDLGADAGLDTFGFNKTLGQSTGASKMGNFNLQDYMKMQGMGSLMSGGVKTMGALATAGETSANRQNLMDLYNQQQQQNQYYGNKLQATYDNPEEYLNSPEALATRQLAMQKLLAQNAAAGRRTAGLPMQNQLMMNQLTNLANYRRGIPQTNYTASGALYDKAAQYSPTGDITTGLASMFTPMSMYALGSYL